jgi:hypothetical protein
MGQMLKVPSMLTVLMRHTGVPPVKNCWGYVDMLFVGDLRHLCRELKVDKGLVFGQQQECLYTTADDVRRRGQATASKHTQSQLADSFAL